MKNGYHGSNHMVSDSVQSLSLTWSVCVCLALNVCVSTTTFQLQATSCFDYYGSIYDTGAKKSLSPFLFLYVSGLAVLMIDDIASSCDACFAVCPYTVQHTLHCGQEALTPNCISTWCCAMQAQKHIEMCCTGYLFVISWLNNIWVTSKNKI